MRAAIVREYGTDLEIADIPRPELAPDSVLVEVHAASVNPFDTMIRLGYLQETMPLTLPLTMGLDVSGVVVGCGEEVTGFAESDEVFARADPTHAGTMAEYVSIREQDLALKPESLTHVEAASFPLGGSPLGKPL